MEMQTARRRRAVSAFGFEPDVKLQAHKRVFRLVRRMLSAKDPV
jgi:hypothetical protein